MFGFPRIVRGRVHRFDGPLHPNIVFSACNRPSWQINSTAADTGRAMFVVCVCNCLSSILNLWSRCAFCNHIIPNAGVSCGASVDLVHHWCEIGPNYRKLSVPCQPATQRCDKYTWCQWKPIPVIHGRDPAGSLAISTIRVTILRNFVCVRNAIPVSFACAKKTSF